MMGRIILHAFDEFYGIVFIVMILFLPCNVHARLTMGVKIMVELWNNKNDWNKTSRRLHVESIWFYPLHVNNLIVDVATS